MQSIYNFQQAHLSYWERESFFKGIDVAIIGSGIVGLTAAIHLKELKPSLKVLVLERGALPIGASTRNAGFACFGSLTELIDDLGSHSESEVFALVEKRWRGLQRLRERIGDTNLQYKVYGGFELFRTEEETIFQSCQEKIDYFNTTISRITKLPRTYQIADDAIAKFGFKNIQHLIWNQAEGQIHTGEMMKHLLQIAIEKGVQIVNGIAISDINEDKDGVILHTANDWQIHANKTLIATNGFAQKLLTDIEVLPARNQVLITAPIPNLKLKACFHYEKGFYYFRNINNRILLGGGRNLAKEKETTIEFGTTSLIQNSLIKLLKEVIIPNQEVSIDQWWSGILGVGQQKKPIVEKYSKHITLALRLGGMGVAIGSLIGEEGAQEVLR